MNKSGFAHTSNINQNTNLWSTASSGGNACFYHDDDFCKSNGLKQFRHEFSFAISCAVSDDAYFYKNVYLSTETNYVVNVMVKSSFLKGETDDFSLLPAYIKIYAGSTLIASSIDCVGVNDEWTELSIGFNSGTHTSVTIRIGAVFSNITKREAVLFSNIRLDVIQPTKVLLMAYQSVSIPGHPSFNGNYTASNTYGVLDALNSMRDQFKAKFELVSNHKIILDITVKVVTNALNHISFFDNVETPYACVTPNDSKQTAEVDFTDYDCVICNYPVATQVYEGYEVYSGQFLGNYIWNPNDNTYIYSDPFSLDGALGFINLSKSYIQEFLDAHGGTHNMDGEIHEFTHFIQACASTLNKCIRKSYPFIDDLVWGTRDVYNQPVSFKRHNASYSNYGPFYEYLYLRAQNASQYPLYANYFSSFSNGTDYKYRWYYDIYNACTQDCYRDSGVWGMLSNWVEIGCTSMTYHMTKSIGLKPGVYCLINYSSKKYLDADLSNTQVTQSSRSYNTDQYWEFKPSTNGSFEIIPLKSNGKRLTATSSSAVTLSNAVSSVPANQRWIVTHVTGSRYVIKSVQYNTFLCLASQSDNYMILSTSSQSSGLGGWTAVNVNVAEEKLYKFTNAYSQKLVSYIPNSGNAVTQNTYLYDPRQIWQAQLGLDGYYRLSPVSNSSLCLTVQSSSAVYLQQSSGLDTQKWLIVDVGSGCCRILPKSYPLKALDLSSSSTSDGISLCLTSYNSSTTKMKWTASLLHSKGTFACRLKNAYSSLYIKQNHKASITNDVVQHSRREDSSYSGGWTTFDGDHKYSSYFVWEFQLQSDGYYKIIPLSTTYKRLTASAVSSNPATLSLDNDRVSDDQKWVLFELSDGKYRISPLNNIDKAIKVHGPNAIEDTYIELWNFGTSQACRWLIDEFDNTLHNKTFHVSFKIAPTKYMDGRDDNSGAARPASVPRDDIVTIYSSNSGNSQKWKFVLIDGYYEILPLSKQTYRLSGILLSKPNLNIGANDVRKKYADDSYEQRWLVEMVDNEYCRIIPRDDPARSLCLANDPGCGFNAEGNLVLLWLYNSTNEAKQLLAQV